MILENYLSVKEVSELLNCSKITIYRKIKKEEIPCLKLGKTIRIPASFLTQKEEIGK